MASADPLIGHVVGDRYRLVRGIGQGGFGAVYEAVHVSLDRRFAIKTLRRHLGHDPSLVQRFEREARLTSSLEHPHIVQVTDFGHDDRLGSWFAMEFLRGEDLQTRLVRKGPIDSLSAVRLMRQIVDAFAYAHAKGVVHRDVKTPNIFLVSTEAVTDHVKVLDFGIARLSALTEDDASGKLTKTGTVMGSPAYMAPEQALNGKVDHRTDLYALGIVFYEMLTGRVPFSGTSALEMLSKQVNEVPAAPSAIRPDLNVHPRTELIVLKCLQKRMDERYRGIRRGRSPYGSRREEGSNGLWRFRTRIHRRRRTAAQQPTALGRATPLRQAMTGPTGPVAVRLPVGAGRATMTP